MTVLEVQARSLPAQTLLPALINSLLARARFPLNLLSGILDRRKDPFSVRYRAQIATSGNPCCAVAWHRHVA